MSNKAPESESAIPVADPFSLFEIWYGEAKASEPNDANAMALATATPQGRPSVRMVLLKGHGSHWGEGGGFVFYTNAESRKGQEILSNMQASLLFHWKSLRRQIRIEGTLEEARDTLPSRITAVAHPAIASVDGVANADPVEDVGDDFHRYDLRLAPGTNAETVLEACTAKGIALRRFEEQRASLHEVFVSMVGEGEVQR